MELSRMIKSQNSLNEADKGDISEFLTSVESNSLQTTIDSCFENHDEGDVNISHKAIQIADLLERTAFQLRNKIKLYDATDKRRQDRITRDRKRRIPLRVAENIFVITVILQLLCLMALALVDALAKKFVRTEHATYLTAIVIMVIFQLTNLIISLAFTVKLTKQYMHHTATTKFLLQSYLSTLFLFGGIYTLIERIMPKSFIGIEGNSSSDYFSLQLYSELLFTSISTGTLCGAASVVAVHWLPELLMSLQMMLSFVYFASILSQVLNPAPPKSEEKKKNERTSFFRKRRKTTGSFGTFGQPC